MHQTIETRIAEIKEICLQIMNIIADKETGSFPYAYTYLKTLTEGMNDVYSFSKAKAYEIQIQYILINLRTWRGNDAKHYKSLLKEYLEYFQGKQNTAKLAVSVQPLWQLIRGIGD